MKLSDLTNHAGEWLRGSGPMSEVVISSRIRLARNVSSYPFLSRCSRAQRTALEHRIRDVILGAGVASQMLYVDLEAAPEIATPRAPSAAACGLLIRCRSTISVRSTSGASSMFT